MALIKCPECGKEISDKSDVCIHCGFPIKKQLTLSQDNMCDINGIIYDLTKAHEAISVCKEDYLKLNAPKRIDHLRNLSSIIISITGINNLAASYLAGQILETGIIPKEFDANKYLHQDTQMKQERRQIEQIRCPKCGSTAISTGARGFNIWTGFIGSGKTVNRCASCGHTWQPKR